MRWVEYCPSSENGYAQSWRLIYDEMRDSGQEHSSSSSSSRRIQTSQGPRNPSHPHSLVRRYWLCPSARPSHASHVSHIPKRRFLLLPPNPSAAGHVGLNKPAYKADIQASPSPNPQYKSSKTRGHKSSHLDPSSPPSRAYTSYLLLVSIPWYPPLSTHTAAYR